MEREEKMGEKVMVIDGGGRGHALALALSRSPQVDEVICAPGNGGTWGIARNIPLHGRNIVDLADFAEKNNVGLTVVGEETPLALGIVNLFQFMGLPVFGPTQSAAGIEISKVFAKNLMAEAGIPTAPFRVFPGNQEGYENALAYVRRRGCLSVVKASGLAAGKGVRVCNTLEEEEQALKEMMLDRLYGSACDEVVIEDFIPDPEISYTTLWDGKKLLSFLSAQDNKAELDGGKGRNTGGMGAIAPVPWVTDKMMAEVKHKIAIPMLAALEEIGCPFSGCLYPGLKMTSAGPMVLEFNARPGDPETQVLMALLESDLFEVLKACVEGRLSEITLKWRKGYAVCVVMVSGGYPDKYEVGYPIYGIEEAEKVPSVTVMHAGTKYVNGQLVTSGGRVLGVTAVGDTLEESIKLAYTGVSRIHFKNAYWRKDIGKSALEGGF